MKGAVTIGIDPGYKTGAVAIINDDFAEVHDLPTFEEGGINCIELMEILTDFDDVDHIIIEKVGPMPKQGVVSMFKLGFGFGQILSAAALSRSPYSLVTPVVWKRAMNLPRDKDAARRLAIQWFPKLADQLKRKKDEHRAEALLLAAYHRGMR